MKKIKPIMIDGVDVAECKTFYINASHPELKQCINPYCKDLCKENPNCYYKQLKRKEQECEELKQRLHQCWNVENSFVEQLDQLKAELLDQEAETLKAGEIISQLESEKIALLATIKISAKRNVKFSDILQEIKEIAKRGFKHCQCNCGAKADLDIILQKCEVIG